MISREQVLKETYTTWINIAVNHLHNKPKTKYINNCVCCQYVYDKLRLISCESCPMISVWPEGCERNNSPFRWWKIYRWSKAHGNIFYSRVEAFYIAIGAMRLLKEFKKKEGNNHAGKNNSRYGS